MSKMTYASSGRHCEKLVAPQVNCHLATPTSSETDTIMSPIEEAKRYAREAILEAYPTAIEVSELSEGMYEFDAIYTDDEKSGISSISIMHNENANAYALVPNPYKTSARQTKPKAMQILDIDARDINWGLLNEEHEIAYLRGDLATSSPESYTIEEMKAISDGMFASTAEAEAAMRVDFQAMTKTEQKRMLQLLASSGSETREWWARILL